MTRIVCVGISVYDFVMAVERLPREPIKHYALSRSEVVGGIAANAARAVARLEAEAGLVSRVGDDLPGRFVREALAAEGLNLEGLLSMREARTSLSAVIVDANGERLLVNDTDPRTLQGEEGLHPELFAAADAILADTRWRDGARVAMQAARRAGVPGILDFDRVPDHGAVEPLLALASHIVFGRQGLAELAGTDDVETGLAAAARRSTAWLAVTSSSEGAYWRDEGIVRRMPAFPIKAVDTLAAGDIFHGAFALALGEGKDETAALRFGNAAAAIKCTRFGGGDGAPRRAEVEALLREGG